MMELPWLEATYSYIWKCSHAIINISRNHDNKQTVNYPTDMKPRGIFYQTAKGCNYV